MSKEGMRTRGTGVPCGCELPCEFWKQNTGSSQKQDLLMAEPSLQLLLVNFLSGVNRFYASTLVYNR